MIEQVRENIYRIEIPLPQNPLKALNSYYIRGSNRSLLIDTGFNREECRTVMDRAIEELDIELHETDILVTHIHADHSGLAGYLSRPETEIYSGEFTKYGLFDLSRLPRFYIEWIKQSGLIEMGLSPDPMVHPGFRYRSEALNVSVVEDGVMLKVGDYELRCINTSGHAPDHMCLYDEKHKLLFSGDHILGGITPNNTIWQAPWTIQTDYLGDYFKSLEKIERLDIELTLPGHRALIKDCRKRIEELKTHHQNRLNNILDILGNKSLNGAQVASQMHWDIDVKKWEDFPKAQKLFASGEALSHLSHLVFIGVLEKELKDGVVYYRKV